MDFVKRLIELLIPDPAYYVPVAILVLAILILATSLRVKRWHLQRANQVLGIVIATLLLLIIVSKATSRWQLIVGLLPSIMVAYQAFFLWLYHPKEIAGNGGGGQRSPSKHSLHRAQSTVDSHFSLRTLFIRYGFPAVLLGIGGIIVLNVLLYPTECFSLIKEQNIVDISDANIKRILLGMKFGSVGAYVYVLLELGTRTFRHDVTGASAMWCLVTLVLGPVLAGTVAVLWRMDPPTDNGWWGAGVVLFFTGFAPRQVIAAIEQAAIQLLKIGTPAGVIESRLIPLSKIRGIGPAIEERLGEEGILDVNSLAAAEPVRLVRNTSFDMKQILSWMDEAILIVTLPKSWEALEQEGITGAIDLAWYYDQVVDENDAPRTPIPPQIVLLAQACKLADPANLVSIIVRLHEDSQVQYIWALYNNFTEFAGEYSSQSSGSPLATTP